MRKLLAGGAAAFALPGVLVGGLLFILIGSGGDPVGATAADSLAIRPVVLAAYEQASRLIGTASPGCSVPWWLLAGEGKVESGHAASSAVDPSGEVSPPILGVLLDGSTPGTKAVPLIGGGFDQAEGPMQILASTWTWAGHRASGDGQAPDPQNYPDAALSAAVVLCHGAGGGDLSVPARLDVAVRAYNPGGGDAYAAQVEGWADYYRPFETVDGGLAAPGLYALPLSKDLLSLDNIRVSHWDGKPAWDLPIPAGTVVFAVEGGTLEPTTNPNCGTGIMLRGDDGYLWTYCHGSALFASSGHVTAGDPIMLSGSTGESTGPHLHLQLANGSGQLGCPQPLIDAWYEGLPMSPADQWTTTNCA